MKAQTRVGLPKHAGTAQDVSKLLVSGAAARSGSYSIERLASEPEFFPATQYSEYSRIPGYVLRCCTTQVKWCYWKQVFADFPGYGMQAWLWLVASPDSSS